MPEKRKSWWDPSEVLRREAAKKKNREAGYTDYRPKDYPPTGSNVPWRGQPIRSPLGGEYFPKNNPVVEAAKSRGDAPPFTSARGYDILKPYYGKELDRKLKEATEARGKPLALNIEGSPITQQVKHGQTYPNPKTAVPGDATRLAKDILPVFRASKLKPFESSPGVLTSAAGYYHPTHKHVRMNPYRASGNKGTLEHEVVGHHVNRVDPAYGAKWLTPNLPKHGILPQSNRYAQERYHAFLSPQELGEAMSRLVRQDFKATGKDMTDERFDEILAGKNTGHFKGWQFDRNRDNAGLFIHQLRRWRAQTQEGKDKGKGQELIDQLRKIHKQFVDTGKPRYFPEQRMV